MSWVNLRTKRKYFDIKTFSGKIISSNSSYGIHSCFFNLLVTSIVNRKKIVFRIIDVFKPSDMNILLKLQRSGIKYFNFSM